MLSDYVLFVAFVLLPLFSVSKWIFHHLSLTFVCRVLSTLQQLSAVPIIEKYQNCAIMVNRHKLCEMETTYLNSLNPSFRKYSYIKSSHFLVTASKQSNLVDFVATERTYKLNWSFRLDWYETYCVKLESCVLSNWGKYTRTKQAAACSTSSNKPWQPHFVTLIMMALDDNLRTPSYSSKNGSKTVKHTAGR